MAFENHFKIVSRTHDLIMDIVDVTIEFYASPGKQYTFSIPRERYRPSKEAIGKEIQNQLGE